MAKDAGTDTGTPTGPAPLTLAQGVQSLLQADADRASDTRRKPAEPEADSEELPAAQGEDDAAVDTGDEPTDEGETEAEPADEQTPEDEPDDEPVYVVKVDGKDERVTLTELTKGYSRQQDYTRRSQALAEERRRTEETANAVAVEREHYRQALEIIETGLKTGVAEPDWDTLERTDPIEFLRQKELWRDRREKIAAVAQEREQVTIQQQQEHHQRLTSYVQTQRQQLLEKVPVWKDPAKATAERTAMRDYAKTVLGYTDDEIKQALDHRLVVMLRKAWLYDRTMSKGNLADKRIRSAPAEVPTRGRQASPAPGRQKVAARVQQMKQLEKTGNIKDAVALLMMEQK